MIFSDSTYVQYLVNWTNWMPPQKKSLRQFPCFQPDSDPSLSTQYAKVQCNATIHWEWRSGHLVLPEGVCAIKTPHKKSGWGDLGSTKNWCCPLVLKSESLYCVVVLLRSIWTTWHTICWGTAKKNMNFRQPSATVQNLWPCGSEMEKWSYIAIVYSVTYHISPKKPKSIKSNITMQSKIFQL